jgi:hypothetical protein
MLVYVRREEAADVFAPIPDELVPRHVRDWFDNRDAWHTDTTWVTEATVYDVDEGLRINALAGRTGFVDADTGGLALTVEGNSRQADVYARVSALVGLPADELRIWYSNCTMPQFILRGDICRLRQCKNLFVQRKPAGAVLTPPSGTIIVFVKFFYAAWEAPLQYIGSQTISGDLTVRELCAGVNAVLGFPGDLPLRVYEESPRQQVRPLPFPQATVRKNGIANAYILVFEVEARHAPPPAFVPGAPIARPSPAPVSTEPTQASYREFLASLPGVGEDVVATVPGYYLLRLSAPLRITVFDHNARTTALRTIECPRATKYSDFRGIVIWATHPEFSPARDTLLLYKKDDVRDGPGESPLSPQFYSHVDQIFPAVDGPGEHLLYALFVPGLALEEYQRSVSVTVQLSLDARTIVRTATIFFPPSSKFPALLERVRGMAVLPPDAPVRAHLVRGDIIHERVSEDASLVDRCTIRCEVIPEDQRSLAPGDALLQITRAFVSLADYLVVEGAPCFVRVPADAKLADVRGLVLEALAVAPENATKARFFLGRVWIRANPAAALQDDSPVVTKPTDALHVVFNLKCPAATRRRPAEGIRIDN